MSLWVLKTGELTANSANFREPKPRFACPCKWRRQRMNACTNAMPGREKEGVTTGFTTVLRGAENRCEAYLAPYSREFARASAKSRHRRDEDGLFAVNLLFSPFTHCSKFLFITVFVVDAACSCSSAFAMDFLSSWPLYAHRITGSTKPYRSGMRPCWRN
jgi:hypothetical protein